MAIVMGVDVLVQDLVDGDYITIGCATSCEFNFINEIIGKTDVNAGLFRKKRVRISDCRGSVQGIMDNVSSPTRLTIWHFLEEAIRRSERTMRFVFTDTAGNNKIIEGSFLVSTLTFVPDVNAFVDFDLQLEGTGGITLSDVAPPGELVCEEWARDSWLLAEGATTISGNGIGGLSFAGKEVLLVFREGTEFDEAEGAPGNREFGYDGTEISFENPGMPALPDLEKITVVWISQDAS